MGKMMQHLNFGETNTSNSTLVQNNPQITKLHWANLMTKPTTIFCAGLETVLLPRYTSGPLRWNWDRTHKKGDFLLQNTCSSLPVSPGMGTFYKHFSVQQLSKVSHQLANVPAACVIALIEFKLFIPLLLSTSLELHPCSLMLNANFILCFIPSPLWYQISPLLSLLWQGWDNDSCLATSKI